MTEKAYSSKWKASKSPAKQRKYRYNAPDHIKRHFLNAPLSKELRTKHNKKSVSVRKGDKVKILRGQFKGHIGKIDRTDLRECKLYVIGAERQKRDGSKALYPLNPSNVMIMELSLDDKRRSKIFERKINKEKKNPKVSKEEKTDKEISK